MKAELNTNGDLVLTLEADEREDLAGVAAEMREARIAIMLHERYNFVPAKDLGAHTQSPVLVDYAGSKGDDVLVSALTYWFPNYRTENPWETLLATGSVTFTFAPLGAKK